MKGILLVIGLACAALLTSCVYRFFHPYLDRELSGPITISSEWLEITPKEPLRAERVVQYLYIYTTKPFEPDNRSWGIRLADGSVVVPEVELVDQQGNIYNLKASSFSLEDPTRANVISGIGFSALEELPKDKVYRAVRIRSDQPIQCSKIIWRCYDPRDRK